MIIWDNIRSVFKKGSIVSKLIYINLAVFVIIALVNIIAFLFNSPQITEKVVKALAVPSSLPALLRRPWTIITYMFTHEGFWHIFFNVLWLGWFGKIFTEFLAQRDLLPTYILGGLWGAILYIISFNVFPAFAESVNSSIALGASAAVMGVIFGISCYVPNYEINLMFFGRVKIIWIALIVLVLTSLANFSINTGGKLAHIGGALYGYYFATKQKEGKTVGLWVNKTIDWLVSFLRPRQKMKTQYRKPRNDFEYNSRKAEEQAEINRILDKISKGGYDCLTKEEKDRLFKESQK